METKNYMFRLFTRRQKKGAPNQLGLTLIELMIVIAIMALISATFYININVNSRKQVEQSSEELLGNLRLVRNMVISKAGYKFAGDSASQYPAGGYGLSFDGTTAPARYFMYASKKANSPGYKANQGDEIIGAIVTLPSAFVIINKVDGDKSFYFNMLDDRQAATDMAPDNDKKYVLTIRWPGPGGSQNGYEGNAGLAEQTSDGFVLANFGVTYNSYIPPPPPPPPKKCKKSCEEF